MSNFITLMSVFCLALAIALPFIIKPGDEDKYRKPFN